MSKTALEVTKLVLLEKEMLFVAMILLFFRILKGLGDPGVSPVDAG